MRKYISEAERVQSQTIDLLRFPLAVMVVFIHMNPKVVNIPAADFDFFSWHGIYNVVGIVFSHVLSAIAVPTFFLISGYLFFINIQQWSWEKYRGKMKNRIRTLIIPYLLWNLAPFILNILFTLPAVWRGDVELAEIFTTLRTASWHIFYDYTEWGTERTNWLGGHLRMTGPYDLPLWFLRDLIVVTLSTPFIYYMIRRCGLFFIGILFLAYISRVWPQIPGLNISAWFFFPVGAYMAINRYNMVDVARKYAPYTLPAAIILLTMTTIYDGVNTPTGRNLFPFFICTGVLTAILCGSICVTRYKMRPNKFLVSGCFFIYALHGVFLPYIGIPLNYTTTCIKSALTKINGGGYLFDTQLVTYILSPFITIALCLVILVIGRRLFPRLTLLFSGNK